MPQTFFKTWDYKEQTKAKPRTTASCMRDKLREVPHRAWLWCVDPIITNTRSNFEGV